MNYVKEFAACNLSVTDLQFYTPPGVDVIKFHYCVGRNTEGKITGMVEVLKNGMCCGGCLAGADFACRDGAYLVLGH